MLGTAGRHGADDGVVVGIAHLDDVVGVDLLAGDPHRLVAHSDGGLELGHGVLLRHAALRGDAAAAA